MRGSGLVTLGLLAAFVSFYSVPEAGLAQGATVEAPAGSSQTLRERWRERRKAAPVEATSTSINGPGDYTFSLEHDGLTRMYRVHVPVGY